MGNALAKLAVLGGSLFGAPPKIRIVMVGLDGAGKTTILHKLKLGEVVTTISTIGFNVDTVKYKSLTLTVWDVGDQKSIRPLWRPYYVGTHAVIFVIDANDSERLGEARDELQRILVEDALQGAPLLVYANKQDRPYVVSLSDITEALGLHRTLGREWHVKATCAVNGDGLYEGLDWLHGALKLPEN